MVLVVTHTSSVSQGNHGLVPAQATYDEGAAGRMRTLVLSLGLGLELGGARKIELNAKHKVYF